MSHEEGKSKARQVKGVSREVKGELPASWAETWAHRETRRARVDTTDVMECAKCHKHGSVYRHHKGYDSLTGLYNKAIGYKYYQWLDVVRLCESCHCDIHFIYEPLVEKWVNRTAYGARHFRTYLIGICDDWLAGRVKTPTIPKAFRQRFHQSLMEWKKKAKR